MCALISGSDARSKATHAITLECTKCCRPPRIFAAASFWRAGFTPDADFTALALQQLLQGAGIAMYFAPLMAISLGGLDPQRMAFGSGLANFFRTTAGSFGASLVTTFWERREAVHRTQMSAALTHQTTLLAATDLFWISGWIFLLLIVSVWFAKRPAGGAVVAGH
jgi:MFS transporter, DHA2 family, multidrug resistance protein